MAKLLGTTTRNVKNAGSSRFVITEDIALIVEQREVRLTIFDEAHQGIDTKSPDRIKDTATVFKDFSNHGTTSLVIAGTDRVLRLIEASPEFAGRILYDHELTPFRVEHPGEWQTFVDLLDVMDDYLRDKVFGRKSGLAETKFSMPLHVAGGGLVGHVATLVELAAKALVEDLVAGLSKDKKITLDHLARAFRKSARRRMIASPFPSRRPSPPWTRSFMTWIPVTRAAPTGRTRMAISVPDLSGRDSFGFSANPFADESLPGFVMRVADRLRFDTADRLAAMAGLRQPGSAVSPSSLTRLASKAGAHPGALERLAYRPVARFAHHVFLNGTVHRELLDLGRRRLCPRCLQSNAYHRAWWDIGLVTACPEHGIRLIDRCPNPRCGRRMAWRRPNLRRCACGLDLTSLVGDPVDPGEADACARLVDMVAGRALPWLPVALAACDRSDLARLAMCLGMFATGWVRERRIETLVNSGADVVAPVVRSGMAALADWPATLHGFLAEARDAEGGRSGRYGAKKALGAFYDWLTLMEAGEVKSALAAAARLYVRLDPELSRRVHRSRLLFSPEAGNRIVGLNEAAAILGVSSESVKAMMVSGALPAVPTEGRGVPMTLSRAAVDCAAREAASSLTLEGAAAALGISKSRTRRLIDAGVVAALRQPAKGARSTWSLSGAVIASLVHALEADCVVRGPREGQVTFEHAAEVFRRRGVGFAAFVRMLVEGRLRVAAVDLAEPGFKRLLFDRVQLRSVFDPLACDDVLSVQAAARKLGLKWQVAAHLVRNGLIGTDGGWIQAGHIERFCKEYVSGAVLARDRQISPRQLAAMLASAGVLPVTGPGVDGGRQNFFRRADVGKVVCPECE